MDSASLEVNKTNFSGNSARIRTLIAACSRSNISLDFDVSLNFTKINSRNCTLYDLQREISTSTILAISTITPVTIVSPSTRIASAVRLSSTADIERHRLTTIYPSAKATSKGKFATVSQSIQIASAVGLSPTADIERHRLTAIYPSAKSIYLKECSLLLFYLKRQQLK